MADRADITPELVRQLLREDESGTGLVWNPRPSLLFKRASYAVCWNTRNANTPALTAINSDGYRHGQIMGLHFTAHRVLWAIRYGDWPKGFIDHIDGNRLNNADDNLRCVSPSENTKNSKMHSQNKSGATGVFQLSGRWYARISVNKTPVSLGSFSSFDEAKAARKAADIKYGYHANHGRQTLPPPPEKA